jgi:uncharacterized protein YhaN
MQLREIHIDGFGIFADARVRGLAPGLNVLYGQNEFGKTTLLEFIRRVLFGFPSRATSANPFPPLRGGKYGGRLVCRMRDPSAPELTISRTSGKGGGPLTVHAANGVEMSESEFSASLGYVSDELYRNVFAISLQELQAAKQLQGEELRSRIYGAGLGLGEVSITDLKKFFAETAERLYKPRGSTQQMNVLASALVDVERRIRETAKLLGQYDAKKEEFDRYAEDEARLRKIQCGLQAEQRSLERQSSLYGTFVGLRAAEDELKPLARLPDIPDASLDELRKRQQSILSLEGKLQETRDQRAGRQSELDHLAFDRALLEHENDIKSLSRSLTQYRDAQRDLPLRVREQDMAREQASHAISELGEDWNEGRVRSFALTTEQRDILHRTEDNLHACEKAAEKAANRLEDYYNQTRASHARPSLPTTYRVIGLAVLGLGAVGCVYSALNGHVIPAIVSGVAGALGVVIALSLGSSSGPLRDKAVEQLTVEREEKVRLLAEAQSAWSSYLAALGLTPSLSPDAVSDQLQSLSALQQSLRTIDERASRIEGMRAVMKTTADGLARVEVSLSEPLPTTDVAAGIEAVDSRLDRAQELRVRKDALLREMKQLEENAAALTANLSTERVRFAAFLSGFSVTTAEELVSLHGQSTRARTLRADIRNATKAIQAAVGVGAPYDEFLATLQSTNPEAIRARLDLVVAELSDVTEKLESTIRLTTGLDKDLSALKSSEELLKLEADAETLRQQLRDAHREWLRTQLALWAIDQAIAKYETTRQPAVIREAQSAFALMTGGKYETLISPLGSDDLRVRDTDENDRGVDDLSRGTREQLYLAMRLGLIEQYERNAEPLPVIMDDILVNFDDDRGPLAIKALAGFATDRQVIVMTCHQNTLEMYRKAGATELVLECGGSL